MERKRKGSEGRECRGLHCAIKWGFEGGSATDAEDSAGRGAACARAASAGGGRWRRQVGPGRQRQRRRERGGLTGRAEWAVLGRGKERKRPSESWAARGKGEAGGLLRLGPERKKKKKKAGWAEK